MERVSMAHKHPLRINGKMHEERLISYEHQAHQQEHPYPCTHHTAFPYSLHTAKVRVFRFYHKSKLLTLTLTIPGSASKLG